MPNEIVNLFLVCSVLFCFVAWREGGGGPNSTLGGGGERIQIKLNCVTFRKGIPKVSRCFGVVQRFISTTHFGNTFWLLLSLH